MRRRASHTIFTVTANGCMCKCIVRPSNLKMRKLSNYMRQAPGNLKDKKSPSHPVNLEPRLFYLQPVLSRLCLSLSPSVSVCLSFFLSLLLISNLLTHSPKHLYWSFFFSFSLSFSSTTHSQANTLFRWISSSSPLISCVSITPWDTGCCRVQQTITHSVNSHGHCKLKRIWNVRCKVCPLIWWYFFFFLSRFFTSSLALPLCSLGPFDWAFNKCA